MLGSGIDLDLLEKCSGGFSADRELLKYGSAGAGDTFGKLGSRFGDVSEIV